MFKHLLSDTRIFYGLVCLLVFIAGGVIYLQVVKSHARRDVQRTQKLVEQRDPPQMGDVAPQSAEGGHYHPDGTYHVGSHDAETSSATPPTPLQPGATVSTPDPKSVMWTGQPLRETSSPDLLSPEDIKARDAKIQKLKTEYEALARINEPMITQVIKLGEERDELFRQREALTAEVDAIRANAELSAEEKERLEAPLFKQSGELGDRSRAIGAEAKALNEEAIRLGDRQKEITAELQALRGKRRKSE